MPRVRRDQGRARAAARPAERVAFVDEERLRFPAGAVPALRVVHLHSPVKAWNKKERLRELPIPTRLTAASLQGCESPERRQSTQEPRSLPEARSCQGKHELDPRSLHHIPEPRFGREAALLPKRPDGRAPPWLCLEKGSCEPPPDLL